MNDSSSAAFSFNPSSSSRFRYQLQRSWLLLSRASLLALGLYVATAGILADAWFHSASETGDLALAQMAAKAFPWNRAIRTKPGYLAMQERPSVETVRILED